MNRRVIHRLACTSIALVAAGCAAASAAAGTAREQQACTGTAMTVTVKAAGSPAVGWGVTLRTAEPAVIASGTTAARGEATLCAPAGSGTRPLVVTAQRPGRPGVILMGTAGTAAAPLPKVFVSDISTVATVFSLNRFLSGSTVSGPSPGVDNAGLVVSNLVNPGTGYLGWVVANPPNAHNTTTLATMRTLADIVATCAGGTRAQCSNFYAAAKGPRGAKPDAIPTALQAIARNPWHNVKAIYRLPRAGAYAPGLTAAPTSWVLSLKYVAGGFDAPGRMAFDARGNSWTGNNWSPPGNSGGLSLVGLDPAGQPLAGSPFRGGGMKGVGYGTAVSPVTGHISTASYGLGVISEFAPDGTTISPPGGYTQGNLSKPQGIAFDQKGNLWIPNFGNGTVTIYLGANPAKSINVAGTAASPIVKPFGIAIDAQGRAWVTNNSTSGGSGWVLPITLNADNSVTLGAPVSGGGIRSPQGISIDSAGNLYTANLLGKGITQITPSGTVSRRSPWRAPGMTGPWGTAVDGNDNVWVADFLGATLNQFCGRQARYCPPGARMGDPISPAGGYANGALQHVTAVQVDPSGNVWLANNWSTSSPLSQPVGGDGLVQYIGLAAPVATPMAGPPTRP